MSTGRDNARWFHPARSTATHGWELSVDDAIDGWGQTQLHIAALQPGQSREVSTDGRELVVVPLSGSVRVDCTDERGEHHDVVLVGRSSVWEGPADVAYIPRGSTVTVFPGGSGPVRVALCGASTTGLAAPKPFRHIAAAEVPIELRGAGTSSREIRNFALPDVLDAESILACEVLTPAGNWSSWPPHKHDEERPGKEAALEEIYYYEIRSTDDRGTDAVGYQRVYGTDERPIDVLAEVRSGDVVLVPHGWHGPSIATPGANLYYLNVMAGPGRDRVWLICDDPAHGWIRGSWADQSIDPRLPIGGNT